MPNPFWLLNTVHAAMLSLAMGDRLGFRAAARGHAPDVVVTAPTRRGGSRSDLVRTQASRAGSCPSGRLKGAWCGSAHRFGHSSFHESRFGRGSPEP